MYIIVSIGISTPTVVGLSATIGFLAIIVTVMIIIIIVLIILRYKRPYTHLKETLTLDEDL